MEDRSTLIPDPRALLLAVGCDGALLARCREAARRLHVEVDAVEVLELASVVGYLRPLVVLFEAQVYGFDPVEFDAVARSVSATRLLVEMAEPLERLKGRIADAMAEAAAARSREPQAPVTLRGRRPSSGIRWKAMDRSADRSA
jgi:hypothetical protein